MFAVILKFMFGDDPIETGRPSSRCTKPSTEKPMAFRSGCLQHCCWLGSGQEAGSSGRSRIGRDILVHGHDHSVYAGRPGQMGRAALVGGEIGRFEQLTEARDQLSQRA